MPTYGSIARGLFRTRAHGGGLLWALRKLSDRMPVLEGLSTSVGASLEAYTARRTLAFDQHHGTETFRRLHLYELEVGRTLDQDFAGWKYGPINPDFFAEILGRLDLAAHRYTFVDVGAGKGLALLLASDWGFRRILGIEFAAELVDIGKENVARYGRSRGRSLDVDWASEDFMDYQLPDEPTVLFFNAPFPEEVAVRSMEHVNTWLAERPRDAIVVYRKPRRAVIDALESCPALELIEWSPYWRAYATRHAVEQQRLARG